MKDLLKFDLYAMIQPKNDRDLLAILDEAIAEMTSINEKLNAVLKAELTVPQYA